MMPSYAVVVVLFISCGGEAFEGSSSEPTTPATANEAGADILISTIHAEAGELERAAELEQDAGARDATSEPRPVCNTPEEFQHECVLWLRKELDDAGTCWGRCGSCDTPPSGAQLLCLKR